MENYCVCGRVCGAARLHVARRAVLHFVEKLQRAAAEDATRKQGRFR